MTTISQLPLVGVDPFDVVYEFLEVELESGEAQIGLLGHPVDRDVDLVDPGLEHRSHAIRGKQSAVCRGVDVFDAAGFFGVSDHVGKSLVQERLAILVHAKHLDRLFKRGEIVDDLLEQVELHHALKAAGLGDHVAMASRAKRAFEIAGACRIDEHDEWRRQRDDRLERRASDEVDAGFEPGFHGVSCKAELAPSYRRMVNRD